MTQLVSIADQLKYWQSFARLLLGETRKERLIAVLSVFFDDSAMAGQSPAVLSMGCYVSTDKKWGHFLREWVRLLNRPDVNVPHMRMTDLVNRRGVFTGWDNERERKLLGRVIRIIRRTTLSGVVVSLDMAAYRELMPRSVLGLGPYAFCVLGCLNHLRQWAEAEGFQEPIACFFEERSGYGKEVFAIEAATKRREDLRRWFRRFRIRPWTFTTKIDHPQLQAADVIAYEANKHWYNKFFTQDQRPTRKSLKLLVREEDFGHYYNHERINRFIEVLLSDENDEFPEEPQL